MPRGNSGTPVSFFAFQDIITGVSGILIILVLLLTLELIEQPDAEANTPPARAADARSALAAAEAERDEIRSELVGEGDAVRIAAAASAGSLHTEIEDLRAEIARLTAELERLTSVASALKASSKAIEVRRFDTAETVADIEAAERRADELRKEIEAAKKDDRLLFTLPKGLNKNGWLAVVSGTFVEVAPIGREAQPISFSGSSSSNSFLMWARERRSDYFLVLVRPSGIAGFDEIDEEFRQQGFSYGYDVIGEAQEVLHPVRGAAP